MLLPDCNELITEFNQGVITITLNRPHKRNAINSAMLQELMAVFDNACDQDEARVVILRGADGNFCAGGDISDMRSQAIKTLEDSNHDSDHSAASKSASWHYNRQFGHLISKVNRAPQLVICQIEGAVLGGGIGLVCASDIAIADHRAKFAMPETSLGIIPAQIAPFVVARIGLTQARRLALLGEPIDGNTAHQLGLVHHLTENQQQMDNCVKDVLRLARRCAPKATGVTKQLLLDSAQGIALDSLLDRAADDFERALTSSEGQEGTQSFVEKRLPDWAL